MSIDEAAKRKPRKKGQKRKSSKHSDLYTDEDPKGTIHGLGFKDAATARKGRAIINKARRKHAHKVQAALVMKQRAKVAKERTKDPEKKKNLNAAYKVWSEFLEKLKAKTKKMKKNEASTLREGAFDNLGMYLDLLNPLEVVKTATEYYAGLAGEASVDSQAAKKRFQKDLKSSGVQDILGFLEYIPYVGVAPGIVNAGMYSLQGNKERAMFSLLAAAGAGVSGFGVAKGLKTQGGQKLVVELDLMVKKFKGAIQGQPFAIAMKPSLEAVENLLKAGAAVLTPILAYTEDKIGEEIDSAIDEAEHLRQMAKKAAENKKNLELAMAASASGPEGAPLDEKKRKHPRYRPPRKDPKTGKYDNPCGKGFAPGAQSGVKSKVGPQSGRRVSNCEPIKKKKNESVLEAVIRRLLEIKNT